MLGSGFWSTSSKVACPHVSYHMRQMRMFRDVEARLPTLRDAEAMSSQEGLPVQLDRWILRGFRWVGGPSNAIESSDESPSNQELVSQFLIGVWLVCTFLLGVGSLMVILLVDPPRVASAVLALVVAVPASMLLLRVVDGLSSRGRLPKYTTSSLALLGCYVVAAAGSLAALVMP